ncbi:MAG TPA: hypothetical protein VJI67_03910 [archaeon]|nr:hypothetical protein [archaeon]HLD80451.1 hypothetical protein [archaeon]
MKKLLAALAFLLLVSAASADVRLVYPVTKTVSGQGDAVKLGDAAPGQSFEVKAARDAGRELVDAYDKLLVTGLPGDWQYSSTEDTEPLTALVSVPKTEPFRSGVYFTLTAFDKDSQVIESKAVLYVNVSNSTTRVSPLNSIASAPHGNSLVFKIVVSNDSIATERVRISSDLPSSWYSTKVLEIPPLSSQSIDLVVTPSSAGSRKFKFSIASELSGINALEFEAVATTHTTFKGSMTPASEGPAIFPLTLLPFYYFTSWIFSTFS